MNAFRLAIDRHFYRNDLYELSKKPGILFFMGLVLGLQLGIALITQLFKKSILLLHLIGCVAPLTAPNGSQDSRASSSHRKRRVHLMFKQWAYSGRLEFPSSTKPWVLPGLYHKGLSTLRTLFT